MSAKPAFGYGPQRRSHDRVEAAFPVSVKGIEIGCTENLSPSGIFFVTKHDLLPGSSIDLSVEFDSPGGKLVLHCRGQIVRIASRQADKGVAVRVTESRLERPAKR